MALFSVESLGASDACRESQIRFLLIRSNTPLGYPFQEMILGNPQALCISRNIEKFETLQNKKKSRKRCLRCLLSALRYYPICCLECENNAQLKPPKIDPGMLQLKTKRLQLHERRATSIKRNEVSALKIKTLASKENLTRTLRTSCVTCKQNNHLR